jgi:hypothetical protein
VLKDTVITIRQRHGHLLRLDTSAAQPQINCLLGIGLAKNYGQVREDQQRVHQKIVKVNIDIMRDYPLAPTIFGDKETRMKRKAANKEDRSIRKEMKTEAKAQKKIERSTGLEYEPRVRKRDMKM